MTIKTIYLARRNPDIAVEDFPRRWKEHAALAGKLPNLVKCFMGVAQCIKVRDALPLPQMANDYDGVNLLTMRSDKAEDVAAIWNGPDGLSMRPDELRVFGDYVENFSMVCREQVILAGAFTKTCLVTFVKARAGLNRETFTECWHALQSRSLRNIPAGSRYLRRLVVNPIVLTPPKGYDFDVVSEAWFDSLDDVLALHADSVYLEKHESASAGLCDTSRSVAMLTRVVHAWAA